MACKTRNGLSAGKRENFMNERNERTNILRTKNQQRSDFHWPKSNWARQYLSPMLLTRTSLQRENGNSFMQTPTQRIPVFLFHAINLPSSCLLSCVEFFRSLLDRKLFLLFINSSSVSSSIKCKTIAKYISITKLSAVNDQQQLNDCRSAVNLD